MARQRSGLAARLKAACAGPHEKMVRYGDHISDMGLRAFFVNGTTRLRSVSLSRASRR